MKEIWDTVFTIIGVFGVIIIVALFVGCVMCVCTFFVRVWEHVNSEPSTMAIHGDLSITPNSEGIVSLGGTFVLHNSMNINGNGAKVVGKGAGKTTIKRKGPEPVMTVKKNSKATIKNLRTYP